MTPQQSETFSLGEAKAYFGPKYRLPPDTSWKEILDAEGGKMKFASRYKTHPGPTPVAVPEYLEAYVLKSLWDELDKLFLTVPLLELHEAFIGNSEKIIAEYPRLDFAMLRAKMSEIYGKEISGGAVTLDAIIKHAHEQSLKRTKTRYGLEDSATRDELINAEAGDFTNGQKRGPKWWDNDLNYGVPASLVGKWKAIKDLWLLIEEAPEESPLQDFLLLIEYFASTHRLDRPERDDDRDPQKVEILTTKLQEVSWDIIDAEQDRARRNNFTRRWPIERNASWEAILAMFERAYEEVYHGQTLADMDAAKDNHRQVLAIQARMRKLLGNQLLKGEMDPSLQTLFEVALRATDRNEFNL
jgi:hypothetical protein